LWGLLHNQDELCCAFFYRYLEGGLYSNQPARRDVAVPLFSEDAKYVAVKLLRKPPSPPNQVLEITRFHGGSAALFWVFNEDVLGREIHALQQSAGAAHETEFPLTQQLFQTPPDYLGDVAVVKCDPLSNKRREPV
jgi:hypothetical protein